MMGCIGRPPDIKETTRRPVRLYPAAVTQQGLRRRVQVQWLPAVCNGDGRPLIMLLTEGQISGARGIGTVHGFFGSLLYR